MRRFLTAFILLLIGLAGLTDAVHAQYIKHVSGYLPAGQTNVFFPRTPNNSLTDTLYKIDGDYHVAGTLLIQAGAEVHFLPNSRIIDSTCGKIIANGFSGNFTRILFRGEPVNSASVEWGHIIVLPGADSVFFANCHFTNFMKRNTVDVTTIVPASAAYSASINSAVNGNGAVMATFSHKTWLEDVIVDSCQALWRGGAFAFMQAPVNAIGTDCSGAANVNDDGRLALANGQVRRLTVRDTRTYNDRSPDLMALGGAIYMASNGSSNATYVTAFLGHQKGPFFSDTGAAGDWNLFERCSANNTNSTGGYFAKGGAIYSGSRTGLVLEQGTFNNDSAIIAHPNLDLNSWGGAIAMSSTSSPGAAANPWAPAVEPQPGTIQGGAFAGLTILKVASFNGCVAGLGGAIQLDFVGNSSYPYLVMDGENMQPGTGVRDSGNIVFNGNIAYWQGGAIYTSSPIFQRSYLAPQNFPWPGGSMPVELRIKYFNNVAGNAGGALFAGNQSASGVPDIVNRGVWYQSNMVNPKDPRINNSSASLSVLGGGAEYVGRADSTFFTEYNNNIVQGGNGGAVYMVDYIPSGNTSGISRYFAEQGYNAGNIKLTPYPFDPRQLTRFLNNHCYLGSAADSAVLFSNTNGAPRGRGGALYVQLAGGNGTGGIDSIQLSRVRIEQNYAYSGSAIWSDQYDMKIMSNLCLIANNHTTGSSSSNPVDLEGSGPMKGIANPADLNASATIWADFEGPIPSYESNSRGDAVYDNTARYILRLPKSPVIGRSGADTLRGMFWGESGPNVITQINPPNGSQQSTFFVDYYNGCFGNESLPPPPYGVYEPNRNPTSGYVPVPIGQLPDTMLMEGRVYDLYDAGTDMKVADYSNRRLAPAEAMSLALPNDVIRLHRFTRNIFDNDPTYVSKIDLYQADFVGPHPIGYPLFLQADVDKADSNRDNYARNYSVLIVQNVTTGEFVRVNAKETVQDEGNGPQQIYQGRLDFVPDSSKDKRSFYTRQRALYTLSLLRPATKTFDEIQRASKLEDSAALDGREYALSMADMTGSQAGDTVCTEGMTGTTMWYAGERYHTLPVRPGDQILVISRTLLWKYGAQYATTHGLQFVIGDVLAPSFVNDIPVLQSDTYNPNRRFVHEDVNYDASDANHTLFRVGGYDQNNFYDPRFLFAQGNYTQLGLSVNYDRLAGDPSVDTTYPIRLYRWLKQSVIYNQNITGSNGYILLTGTPHNPDVVPGGEGVTATVMNFPPNYASEYGLKNAGFGNLGPDSNNLSMWTFPPYMNWNSPVCAQPGFEPDTLCVRPTMSTYHFRIIVMDSLPRFTFTPPAACMASLTDSLRYRLDVQTDDEAEDANAAAETPSWDFRYGRTSYRFLTRPGWMLMPNAQNRYGMIDTLSPQFGTLNFTQNGIINVSVDSATAIKYLTPVPQVNGELNFDTTIAVEAHDGHTGKSVMRWPVTVNIAPAILNTSLPNAKEGVDYSLNFNDTAKINQINVYDPNFADFHTYKLIYLGDVDTEYRDPNYKVGKATLVGTTPKWLHIDPYSGVLTGTPDITDAPRGGATSCGAADTVLVVVQDQCHLTTWTYLPLNVDSTQHPPFFIRGPHDICVTNKVQSCDSVLVVDRDLLRGGCLETLTVTSDSAQYVVTPGTVQGQLANDTAVIHICTTPNKDQNYFTKNPGPDSVHLHVVDVAGNTDDIVYAVHIGDVPTFMCNVWLYNVVTASHPLQDLQRLCFGAGSFGTDSIDARYCEMEIPPPPYSGIFDARWELPIGGKIEGTYIDIRRDTNQATPIAWQVKFQSGNEGGQSGNLFPMEICWRPSCMDPAKMSAPFNTGNFYLRNPQNAQEFSINMFSGGGPVDPSLYTLQKAGSDSLCLVIRDTKLANAIIVFQPAGMGVDQPTVAAKYAIEPSYPNPFSSATTINFSVAERSAVRIDIFDTKGSLVRTLVSEQVDPGTYPVTWDGTDANGQTMANGQYIARMTAGMFTSSVKMILERTN